MHPILMLPCIWPQTFPSQLFIHFIEVKLRYQLSILSALLNDF